MLPKLQVAYIWLQLLSSLLHILLIFLGLGSAGTSLPCGPLETYGHSLRSGMHSRDVPADPSPRYVEWHTWASLAQLPALTHLSFVHSEFVFLVNDALAHCRGLRALVFTSAFFNPRTAEAI
jgi:hypothetical protein